MACNITKGRGQGCREAVGGNSHIYFAELDSVDITSAAGSISDLGTVSLYRYTLPRNGATVTETIQPSVENGTVFYEQSVEMSLNGQSVADRNEIMLLAKNRLVVIAKDNDGVYRLFGAENGCELSAGTATSGTAKGDRNGYELTFTAEEKELGLYFDGDIEDAITFPDVTIVSA